MSKGKEFPPRRKIPAAGVYYKGPTMAWRVLGRLGEDELEFISAAEHSHLLAEARREGRAEVLDILRVVHGVSEPAWQRYPYFLVSGFLAEAAEGASDDVL